MKKDFHQRYHHEDSENKSVDFVLIKRLLTYLQPYRYWVLTAIAILLLSKALEAWVPIQIGQLTQYILTYQALSSDSKVFFDRVMGQGLWILLWIMSSYLLDTVNIFIKNRVGQQALLTLRAQVYGHIQKLPVAYYDRQAIGRLMTRTIHDVDQINQLFSESVIPIIGSLFLFTGILTGIFIINWKIGLGIIGIMPFVWWFTHHFRHYQRISYQLVRAILSSMNAFMQEHLMGIGIIRSFNLYKQEKKNFDELNQDYFDASIETIHHFALFFAGIEWIQNVTLALVFVILVQFSGPEDFQAGTYFTISLYGLMVFRPLADLAERYNVLQSAMASAEKIFDILDTPIETLGAQPGLPLEAIESIEFDQVWFAYEKEDWVLQGLSLYIQKGESVALVGMTGSGKTSVLNLLLRLYEFQKGSIKINGQDIRCYSVAALRRHFSVILQDPVIFSGTVEDNIALYDSNISLERVKTSAAFVNLDPLIEKLPSHYQSHLRERGISLSAGEMQLISLARAVAHHRSVVVFDEATSNIDTHTERLIQDSLEKIFVRQTALIIAHRLSTVRDVNRIYVLADGKVAEDGTHRELMAKEGVYENLYKLQFSNY